MYFCTKLFQNKRIRSVSLFTSLLVLLNLCTSYSIADSGGHFILPELNGVITIDDEDAPATCSDADWPGAGDFVDIALTPVTTGNTATGKLLIYHPEDPLADEELYVFFSINDNSPNVSVNIDNLVLMFDLAHDHATTGATSFIESDDRGIRFNRDDSVQRVYGDITNPLTDSDPTAFPDIRACISELNSTHWLIEARILPSDIGLNSFNDLLGIAVLADDRTSGSSSLSRWPSTVVADPNTWANMVTRSPIDFVLLLDQSGSMSGDKWTSAKQAGNNYRALLSLLHDSQLATEYTTHLGVSGGGDRLGLATFSTSLSNDAHTNQSLTSIDSTASDFTGVLPASPGGGTPMVAGVNETFDMFGGAFNLGAPALTNPNIVRQKVVMLLSDGKHNTPSTTMNFDTVGTDFDYLPVTPDCDLNTGTNSLVRINTVAVGTDTTVDTDKLDDIKSCYSGKRLDTIYTAVGATGPARTAELSRFYFQTVYPYYHLNMLNDTGADFELNDGERKLILFAFWPDTSVTSLSVTSPSSSVETGTCEASLGFCYLVIDNPEQGLWTNFSAPGAVGNGQYVLLDLRVEAKFAIDNEPHGTSSDITLKARLREDGKPITGATVNVQIARPEEGFGTFASTHSLDGCDIVQPDLPPIPPSNRGDHTTNDIPKLIPATSAEAVSSAATSGDTNPPRFALMERLLEICGKTDLNRITDPGLQLYDDGSHGDATQDDGIYTLVYNNTTIEGSYIFRFTASGTTLNGQNFVRMKDFGEYIRVEVDPSTTNFDARDVAQVGNTIYREYHIVPRDLGGEYLGPGYAGDVSFQASSGSWVGPLRDYNNGIYARVLKYDVTQPEPDVSVVVQDKTLTLSKDPFEFVAFAGATLFDSGLSLDDGVVLGARLNYRYSSLFYLGGEIGITPTETTAGDSGNMIQLFANARYQRPEWEVGNWQFYGSAGIGFALLRGFATDDEAVASHVSVGTTYEIDQTWGVRLEQRILWIDSIAGAGSSTNSQTNVGVVFRF